MITRRAKADDFETLYEIGQGTSEFRVSAKEVFMDAEEFRFGIVDPHSVFLVAEENAEIIGFVYASLLDHDKPLEKQSACLIYLTVLPEYRHKGIANELYTACERSLKEKGVSGIYGWANVESDGAIVEFMKKQGFAEGHKYVWMDKEI
jgi:ribosomal protein S18 acetylase RimI-like enzyme